MRTRNCSREVLGVALLLFSCGATLTNIFYAMSFPNRNPGQVTSSVWLDDYSTDEKVLSVCCGLATLLVSGGFTYKFLKVIILGIIKEISLFFGEGGNRSRFITSNLVAALAAMAGGSLASQPFIGVARVGMFVFGFITTYAFSLWCFWSNC